jgi:hypothetical protein
MVETRGGAGGSFLVVAEGQLTFYREAQDLHRGLIQRGKRLISDK